MNIKYSCIIFFNSGLTSELHVMPLPEQSPCSPFYTDDLQIVSGHLQCPYFLHPVVSDEYTVNHRAS